MTLTIDIGNTRTKWALFEQGTLAASGIGQPQEQPSRQVDRVIVCATGRIDEASLGDLMACFDIRDKQYLTLSASTPLPITLDYATPTTLGPDRIAAACGAWSLFPNSASLIIDAGTCITIDYLDASGVYRGGAILPGIEMKFRALHTFTAKLPLIDNVETPAECAPLGRTTAESMAAGVLAATRYEVEGFVSHYRRMSPRLNVILTGGAAPQLATLCHTSDNGWSTEPNLVMIGLNEIEEYKMKDEK